MNKLKERILYELRRKPEIRKHTASDIAGRILIGFFVTMILLTMVSRAADSITVAKIDVATGNRGRLTYLVKGSGVLVEKSEKYLDVLAGVRIASVYAKEGSYVEKGEPLYQYDTSDLEERLGDLEDDLRKAEITIEINALNNSEETMTNGIERASLTLERANLDLKSAKNDLKDAKKTVKKQKIEEYKTAKEMYEEAKAMKEEQIEKRDKAITDATDNVTKAEEALNELYENRVNAQSVISEYKMAIDNPAVNALINAETNIYKQYYGEEGYSKHQKEVTKARKSLNRAEEDYSNAKGEQGNELTDSQRAVLRRAIVDAEDELSALTEMDVKLQNAITVYNVAVRNNNEELTQTAYQALFELLYKEDKDKKKQIKAASDAITDSKEALEDTKKEWDKTIATEDKKVEKAFESFEKAELTYLDIVSETYDYSKDVKTEEELVDRTARAVEDAKLNYEEAKQADSNRRAKDITNQKVENLNEESAEIDLQKKQEAVTVAKEIMKSNGNVVAPESGIVSKLELVAGNYSSGTEKIALTTGNCGFVAKISNDDAKHLSPGDEVEIVIGNENDKVTVAIETIGLKDLEGQVEITAVLPQEQYFAATAVEFTIRKQSEQYDVVIPIQALRMDAKGKNFILISREKDTVLGKELTAFRMDITLLDKDGISVAVEGGLLPTDNIIIGSSKYIEEGDRVRINESNEQ